MDIKQTRRWGADCESCGRFIDVKRIKSIPISDKVKVTAVGQCSCGQVLKYMVTGKYGFKMEQSKCN
jgi:hypothetical protein